MPSMCRALGSILSITEQTVDREDLRGMQAPMHVGTAEGRGEAPEAGSVGSWIDTETEPEKKAQALGAGWLVM